MKYNFKLKKERVLDLLIEFSYLLVIFLVPLYFSVIFPTYNIFELSKLFILKVFVYFLLFLSVLKYVFYSLRSVSNSSEKINLSLFFKKYYLIPFIFILGLGLNLFFSINPWQSFFGSYDRQAGYLSYLFYFLWFTLLVFSFLWSDNLKSRIRTIFFTVSLSAFLVSIYGILQSLGIDFLNWPENPLLTRRAFSTFGQPNFLASWLLLTLPIAGYLVYESKNFLIKFFGILVFSSQLICLFLTSSRGAMLALVFTLILLFFYLFKNVKINKKKKLTLSLVIFFIALGSTLIFTLNSPERVKGLVDFTGGSLAARVNYYSSALEAISVHPFFGYGLENGAQVFLPYYSSDWGVYANVGISTDRAHNLALDILLSGGLFLLLLFAILYFYFLRLAFKNIFKTGINAQSLAIGLGGLSYLISLLFNFSFVTGEIYFFLFLAILISISFREGSPYKKQEIIKLDESKKNLDPINLLFLALSFLVIISTFFGINYEFRAIKADHYFSAMYGNLMNKEYFTAFTLNDYLKEERTNKVNQLYYNRVLAEILASNYKEINEVLSKKLSENILIDIDKKLPDNGYRNIFVKGEINLALENYEAAEKSFQELIKFSPYWPEAYLKLADTFFQKKSFKEAVVYYQLTLKILPSAEDIRLNKDHRDFLNTYKKNILKKIGDIYFKLNNYSEAEKYYQQAYGAYSKDFTLFKNIADTYYLRGDFLKTLEYNLRGSRRSPKDYHWPLSIAILYKENGDITNARYYFNQAFSLDPDQELLKQLKSDY